MAYRVGNEIENKRTWRYMTKRSRRTPVTFFFFKSFLRVSKRTKGRQSSNQSWSDDDGGGSSDQDICTYTVGLLMDLQLILIIMGLVLLSSCLFPSPLFF
jgi:hypothetical protein